MLVFAFFKGRKLKFNPETMVVSSGVNGSQEKRQKTYGQVVGYGVIT